MPVCDFCKDGLLDTRDSRFIRISRRISWALDIPGGGTIVAMVDEVVRTANSQALLIKVR